VTVLCWTQNPTQVIVIIPDNRKKHTQSFEQHISIETLLYTEDLGNKNFHYYIHYRPTIIFNTAHKF